MVRAHLLLAHINVNSLFTLSWLAHSKKPISTYGTTPVELLHHVYSYDQIIIKCMKTSIYSVCSPCCVHQHTGTSDRHLLVSISQQECESFHHHVALTKAVSNLCSFTWDGQGLARQPLFVVFMVSLVNTTLKSVLLKKVRCFLTWFWAIISFPSYS